MAHCIWAKEFVVFMKIRKNTLFGVIALILILGVGFFVFAEGKGEINGKVISGNAQVVKFYVEGSQYVFEPSSVKKGIPVRLEADISRMPGCSKSIISSELGIRKTFSSSDNTLVFTPNKAGTFYVACSMNMYKGTLTVLESDGAKNSYVQTPPSSGASCGAGGGGCGCGG